MHLWVTVCLLFLSTCVCVASGSATPCVRGYAALVGRGWSCSRWAPSAASPAPESWRACCVCRGRNIKSKNDHNNVQILLLKLWGSVRYSSASVYPAGFCALQAGSLPLELMCVYQTTTGFIRMSQLSCNQQINVPRLQFHFLWLHLHRFLFPNVYMSQKPHNTAITQHFSFQTQRPGASC